MRPRTVAVIPSAGAQCLPQHTVPVRPWCPYRVNPPTPPERRGVGGPWRETTLSSQLFPAGSGCCTRDAEHIRGQSREAGTLSRFCVRVGESATYSISRWVLRCIKIGYAIQFRCRLPSLNGVLSTVVDPEQALVMIQEVQTLPGSRHPVEAGAGARGMQTPHRGVGAPLGDFWQSANGPFCYSRKHTLSSGVLPSASSSSWTGPYGTGVAEAASVRLFPDCSASGSSRENTLGQGPSSVK